MCRLTVDAEHHADRGLPNGVPGHAFIAACVRGPNVVDGQESLRADMKFPTFCHLNPILEQNRSSSRNKMKEKLLSLVCGFHLLKYQQKTLSADYGTEDLTTGFPLLPSPRRT